MGDYNISSSERSNLKTAFDSDSDNYFEVDSAKTDGPFDQKETKWEDENWEDYFGYYTDDKIPEITAVIDAKATWTVGKGFKADEETTMLLDSIKGFGVDTFNTILENAMRTMLIGGNFYAEIIRDEEGVLTNLKPLDSGVMSNIVDGAGVIKRFEQKSKVAGKKPRRLEPEKVFYLARNRVADEIHGRGIIQKLKRIMDMKNRAMNDWDRVLHHNIDPMIAYKLDTQDTTKIAAFKAKVDAAKGKGDNMYIPQGSVEFEIISLAPNANLSPMSWIEYLDNLLYQTAGVPKIVVGGSSEFTEKASSIVYLAFQQSVEEEQLYIEEQVLAQLNLVIELEFPVSLENELLSDEKKDPDPTTVQPNETTAGAGQ